MVDAAGVSVNGDATDMVLIKADENESELSETVAGDDVPIAVGATDEVMIAVLVLVLTELDDALPAVVEANEFVRPILDVDEIEICELDESSMVILVKALVELNELLASGNPETDPSHTSPSTPIEVPFMP